MKQEDFIEIGVIGKPHGVKGAFFLVGRSHELGFKLKGSEVRAGLNFRSSSSFRVESFYSSQGRPVVGLVECTDRAKAESLRGGSLWVSRELVPLDEESEYFWQDLLQKIVVTPQGNALGEIKAVDNFGATDIISIESSQGLLDIPFVKQYFDMSFDSSSSEIRLIVDPDLFSDCWEKPT